MDRFAHCKSGLEVLEVGRQVIKEFAPWEHHFLDDLDYVHEDRFEWLVGRIAPTVRQPFGILPSGKLLMPLGDTAVTFDPSGGQGATRRVAAPASRRMPSSRAGSSRSTCLGCAR